MTDETRAQRSGSDKITATRSPTSLTARAWNASVQREQLPQSVKRYAAWLAARPDRKTPGLYRGGQAVAAQALGLSIRTVRDAERKLIDNGAMARERRGVRQTTYSRMTLLPPPFNRQKLPVEVGSQPEDGGWLKTGSQPAETAATNVLRSDTSALVLKPTGHPSVFIAAVVPTDTQTLAWKTASACTKLPRNLSSL